MIQLFGEAVAAGFIPQGASQPTFSGVRGPTIAKSDFSCGSSHRRSGTSDMNTLAMKFSIPASVSRVVNAFHTASGYCVGPMMTRSIRLG